jgi:hypothetical protein
MAVLHLKEGMRVSASDKTPFKVLTVQADPESIVKIINSGKLMYPVNMGELRGISCSNIIGVYADATSSEPEVPAG